MVTIIGLSEEEKASNQKLENMLALAKELFPKREIYPQRGFICIKSENSAFSVDPRLNRIYVQEIELLDEAIQLAQAYENSLDIGEITIRKNYE